MITGVILKLTVFLCCTYFLETNAGTWFEVTQMSETLPDPFSRMIFMYGVTLILNIVPLFLSGMSAALVFLGKTW